jgi:hypothetical protein
LIQNATPVSATIFIIPKKVAVLMMPVAADEIRKQKTDIAAEVCWHGWIPGGHVSLQSAREIWNPGRR